jgi:hypothetical protein
VTGAGDLDNSSWPASALLQFEAVGIALNAVKH